jgi:hypothetical protein
MAGAKWAQKLQMGRESVAGTAVAATTIWRGPAANLKDDRQFELVEENIGLVIPSDRGYISRYEGMLSMAETPATFEQLPHILEAGVKAVGTGVADGGGGSGKIYAYPFGLTSVNTLKTYTLETGDNEAAEEMEYSFVERFRLSGERGRPVMTQADWRGRQVATATFTTGISVPAVEDILAQKGTLWIDAESGSIGTTPVSQTLLAFSLTVDTGWRAKYTLDGGVLTFAFAYFDRDSFSALLDITYEHNSTATAEKVAWRALTGRLMRLQFAGSNLTTPGSSYSTKLLRLDLPGRYETFDALDSDEGNSIVKARFRAGYNAVSGLAPTITVVNQLASVP